MGHSFQNNEEITVSIFLSINYQNISMLETYAASAPGVWTFGTTLSIHENASINRNNIF